VAGARKADSTGVLKVAGKVVTAHRVAWELTHRTPAPGARVRACPAEPACVPIDHLTVIGANDRARATRGRAPRGGGSKVEVRPGVCCGVTLGRYADGEVRRVHKTVPAATAAAAQALAAFVAEVHEAHRTSRWSTGT
jgi:hypothetical protein